MALLIKGPRRGQKVNIVDISGQGAIVENGQWLKLYLMRITGIEKEVILKKYVDTPTFHKYFDLEHFIDTGEFIRPRHVHRQKTNKTI